MELGKIQQYKFDYSKQILDCVSPLVNKIIQNEIQINEQKLTQTNFEQKLIGEEEKLVNKNIFKEDVVSDCILNEPQKQVIKVDNKYRQLEQQFMMDKQVELKLIDDSNQQSGWCKAIVFNKDGSIMISSDNCGINIWNFEQGRFKLSNYYNKHRNPVYCLVYSKKTDNFISACAYNEIICWQQINQNEWQCSQPFKQHSDSVYCLMLNRQEDRLISGGCDHKIIVWQVDFMKNDLTFLYSLNKHSNSIQSLSVNQSETVLASCGYSHFIIWEKGQQGKWKFKYIIEQIKQLYLFTNCQQFQYNKIQLFYKFIINFIFQFHYQQIRCFIWKENPFHQ